jgi:phosphatidylglycerol---prolipoprotein diacylglyceryl transferase
VRPTLFHLGHFPVHSYGSMIAIGVVIGVAVAVRRGRRIGFDSGDVLDLTFYAVIIGLVGARLLYVLMHASEYARLCAGTAAPRAWGQWLSDCAQPLRFWQGGLVFLGGGILAAVSCIYFARRKKLAFGDVADVLAPSVSIAHVFGRLGCFMVGCCYGKPWAAGVQFPEGSVAYSEWLTRRGLVMGVPSTPGLHPTQLYESIGEACIFVFLTWLWRRRRFPGAVALSYAIGYGIVRFLVEILRGDDLRAFVMQVRSPGLAHLLGVQQDEVLFLSTAQLTALLMALAAAIAYIVLRRTAALPPAPVPLP